MSREVETAEKKTTMVQLKPIVRNGWLPKGHDGEYRFTGCEVSEVPSVNVQTGQRVTGLTEEDEVRLEKALRLSPGTLNKYNNDFWGKYRVRIPKEGRIFYMDNPKDELDILTLKANPRIANSAMEVLDNPGAHSYLTSVEQEAETENARDTVERTAIKRYSQLTTLAKKDVLRVYNILSGKPGVKITDSLSEDFVESSLYKKLKTDPEEFLRVVDESRFKTIALIDKLVAKRILIKSGSKYTLHGGDVIGTTLDAAVEYLDDARNQDVKITLSGKLED